MAPPVAVGDIEAQRRSDQSTQRDLYALVRFFPNCALKYIDYLSYMTYASYNHLVMRSGIVRPLESIPSVEKATSIVEKYTLLDFPDWIDHIAKWCSGKSGNSLEYELRTYYGCVSKGNDPFAMHGPSRNSATVERYMYCVLKMFLDLNEALAKVIRVSCYSALNMTIQERFELVVTGLSTIFTDYIEKVEWHPDRIAYQDIRIAENLLRSIGEISMNMWDLNDQLVEDLGRDKHFLLNVEYMKFLQSQTNIQENSPSYLHPSECETIFVDTSGDEVKVWQGFGGDDVTEMTVVWSPQDQNVFFKALARYSIHFIDCIHRMLPHKTTKDISTFYQILKNGARHHTETQDLETGYEYMASVESAYEVSDAWLKFENKNAAAMANVEFRSKELPHLPQKKDALEETDHSEPDDDMLSLNNDSTGTAALSEPQDQFFEHSCQDPHFLLNKIYQAQVSALLKVDSIKNVDIEKITIPETVYSHLKDLAKQYLVKLLKKIQEESDNLGEHFQLGLRQNGHGITDQDVWNAVDSVPCTPISMVYTSLHNICNYLHFSSGFNELDSNWRNVRPNLLERKSVGRYLLHRRLHGDDVEKYCTMMYLMKDDLRKSYNDDFRQAPHDKKYLHLLEECESLDEESDEMVPSSKDVPGVKVRSLDDLDDSTSDSDSEDGSEESEESEEVSGSDVSESEDVSENEDVSASESEKVEKSNGSQNIDESEEVSESENDLGSKSALENEEVSASESEHEQENVSERENDHESSTSESESSGEEETRGEEEHISQLEPGNAKLEFRKQNGTGFNPEFSDPKKCSGENESTAPNNHQSPATNEPESALQDITDEGPPRKRRRLRSDDVPKPAPVVSSDYSDDDLIILGSVHGSENESEGSIFEDNSRYYASKATSNLRRSGRIRNPKYMGIERDISPEPIQQAEIFHESLHRVPRMAESESPRLDTFDNDSPLPSSDEEESSPEPEPKDDVKDFIVYDNSDDSLDDDIDWRQEDHLTLADHNAGMVQEFELMEQMQRGNFFDGNLTENGILKMNYNVAKAVKNYKLY